MKKIFTLIASAVLALSANAQKYEIVADATPAAGSKITSVENITMTYSVTGDAAFKAAKNNGETLQTVSGYTAKTDGNGVNPVNETDSQGKEKYNPEKGAPTKCTFYVFEPTTDGNLEVFIICNADKVFYVLEDGTNIATSMSAISPKAYNEAGEAIEDLEFTDGKFNSKVYGTVTFSVKAGKKYHVFVAGSKLGFGGFTFPAPDPSAVESVAEAKAEAKAAPVKVITANGVQIGNYNIAGQQVK